MKSKKEVFDFTVCIITLISMIGAPIMAVITVFTSVNTNNINFFIITAILIVIASLGMVYVEEIKC